MTVKRVLEIAREQSYGTFDFNETIAVNDGVEVRSPNSFTAVYIKQGPTSVSSGNTYEPGIYNLSENTSARPAYTVWQYYIRDANGSQVNTSGEFIAYDNPEKAVVPDGGSVIFRLLTILAGPNGVSPRFRSTSSIDQSLTA